MAAKGGDDEYASMVDIVKTHDLVAKFKKYCTVGAGKDKKESSQMLQKHCGKLVSDSWAKSYKDIGNSVDASVYSKLAGKPPKMELTVQNCAKFIGGTALEVAKREKKKDEPAPKITDTKVIKLAETLAGMVKDPNIHATKTSKTGNVDGMTDTSKYTGSHKERFDAEGKGKGAAGRQNITDNSGYVGNYKGSGTYDKKH